MRPAAKGRGSDPAGRPAAPHEGEFDLLTAALIGAVIGASATLLLRRPQRPPSRSEMAMRAVKRARGPVRRGAKWAAVNLDPAALGGQVGEFVESARDTINAAVEAELRDLRRSIRRQRRKLGV